MAVFDREAERPLLPLDSRIERLCCSLPSDFSLLAGTSEILPDPQMIDFAPVAQSKIPLALS